MLLILFPAAKIGLIRLNQSFSKMIRQHYRIIFIFSTTELRHNQKTVKVLISLQ